VGFPHHFWRVSGFLALDSIAFQPGGFLTSLCLTLARMSAARHRPDGFFICFPQRSDPLFPLCCWKLVRRDASELSRLRFPPPPCFPHCLPHSLPLTGCAKKMCLSHVPKSFISFSFLPIFFAPGSLLCPPQWPEVQAPNSSWTEKGSFALARPAIFLPTSTRFSPAFSFLDVGFSISVNVPLSRSSPWLSMMIEVFPGLFFSPSLPPLCLIFLFFPAPLV